jgi:flagellin
MSGITGIGSSYTEYGKIASGKQIQSASDGAAELAIVEKLEVQANTYNVGAENIKQATGLANVADGALSGINDYLSRIHELSIRSMGGFMSDSDKSAIQAEIDQMKQGIEQLAGTAKYNETYLLDGSVSNINIATGSGSSRVSGANSTLKALGLEDYNIMGEFDLSIVEKAMEKVNGMRSKIGAETNGLEAAYNYATNASYNTIGSKSRIEDLDVAEAISDMKKQQTLQQYSMNMRKKQMEQEANLMKGFFV